MKVKYILFSILIFTSFASVDAQMEQEAMLFKAMGDELKRSMDSLSLPGMQKPFFMAYTINRSEGFTINSSYGAITSTNLANTNCEYSFRVDLLVGNYHRSNINYTNVGYVNNRDQIGQIPDDCCYDEVRRMLWMTTDRAYKKAVTEYDQKMIKWKQMNVSPEMEALDDLSRITPIEKKVKHLFNQTFDRKEYWKQTLKATSSLFTKYPDIIDCSSRIKVISTDRYYLSNEGSKIIYPQDCTNFSISATVRSEDGGDISTSINYNVMNDSDIPSRDSLMRAAKKIAQRIIALKNAPRINENYTGPVLFEGNEVANRFSILLKYKSGMTGYRIPLTINGSKSLEDRMNQKILPDNMTVTSEPGLKYFNGKALWGNFEVDAEGVIPPEKMILVEKGILRNVANGRIPTLKTAFSNGHNRPCINGIGMSLTPGVIRFEVTEGESKEQLKAKLIRLAIEGGMKYAYIVRSESFSDPVIYRVNVSDGSELLVRGGAISKVDILTMKKIAGTSSEQSAYNMYNDDSTISIICPVSIILEDIEITNDGKKNLIKKPVVTSPLADKQKKAKSKK